MTRQKIVMVLLIGVLVVLVPHVASAQMVGGVPDDVQAQAADYDNTRSEPLHVPEEIPAAKKAFDDVFSSLADFLTSATGVARQFALVLFTALLTIDLTLFGLQVAGGQHNTVGALVWKGVSVAFFSYIILDFPYIVMFIFDSVGQTVAFIMQQAAVTMNDGSWLATFDWDQQITPGAWYNEAWKVLVSPLVRGVSQTSGLAGAWEILNTGMMAVWFITLNLISSAVLIITIILIALQIAMVMLEFYVLVLFGTLLMPFIILEPTKFIGAKIIPAIVGQLIKYAMVIMVAMLVLGLWDAVVLDAWFDDDTAVGMEHLLGGLIVGVMGAFMAIQIPALAQTILTGTPNLSASAMLRNMAAMTYMAGKGVDAGKQMVGGAKGQQVQGLSGAVGQGARAAVKGAKAAATGGASVAQGAVRAAARGGSVLRNPPGWSGGSGGGAGGGGGGAGGGGRGPSPNAPKSGGHMPSGISGGGNSAQSKFRQT